MKKYIYIFSLIITLIIGTTFGIILTKSALTSTKTAQGSITFDFKSGAVSLEHGLDFYYDTDKLTYGSSTEATTTTIANATPLIFAIDSENQFDTYWVKVEIIFTSITDSVSFGSSTYAYESGTYIMSAMSKSSANSFSSSSTQAVAKGSSFDLMNYLKNFTITNEDLEITEVENFKIRLTLDINNQFNTTSRSQTTINCRMGINISPKFTLTGFSESITPQLRVSASRSTSMTGVENASVSIIVTNGEVLAISCSQIFDIQIIYYANCLVVDEWLGSAPANNVVGNNTFAYSWGDYTNSSGTICTKFVAQSSGVTNIDDILAVLAGFKLQSSSRSDLEYGTKGTYSGAKLSILVNGEEIATQNLITYFTASSVTA